MSEPSTAASAALASPAQLAKGALRRLALAKLEPTPAHYARAYADEAGTPLPPDGALPARAKPQIDRLLLRVTDDTTLRGEISAALMEARFDDLQRALDRTAEAAAAQARSWAQLIDRLVRGLERGARHWTGARKKDSLQRVLDGSRSDAQRLQQRLGQLITAWDQDEPDADVDAVGSAPAPPAPATPPAPAALPAPAAPALHPSDTPAPAAGLPLAEHPRIVDALQTTVRAGLPTGEARAVELADTLAVLAARVANEGATAELADAVAAVCLRARCLLGLRHELVDELMALCQSLTQGLADEAETPLDSPIALAANHLQERLDGAHSARAVRAARHLLDDTRTRQRALRSERLLAREAIKQMVHEVLQALGGLASATGQFNDKVSGYAQAIESADSLDSLAEVVRALAGESRAVHALVTDARQRLAAEHAHASALQGRVQALEDELRRVHGELTTDALTQVANRRGLALAFDREKARAERAAEAAAAKAVDVPPLAVALIDIDNFKKLNDSLGHAAGDVALQRLAVRVKEWLRPVDHLARFGGEEFVVLLPATALDEASQVLTRLQRQLSASLFMHEGREVFVTFSAGVTAWRPGETMEAALGRADEGLYEAKRTGKNRTCMA